MGGHDAGSGREKDMRLKVILCGIVGVGTLLAIGCGDGAHKASVSREKHSVAVREAHTSELEGFERVPGNVHAVHSATIAAKISGRVLKIHVVEGDAVQSGKVLLLLDAHESKAKYDQAVAAAKQADQDLKRYAQLLPAGAATRQEYDSAVARASVAKAGVDEAQAMLSYAEISAPFDGVVTKKIAEEGDLAVPGKPLIIVERQDLYRFETDIPETLIAGIRAQDTLQVSLTGMQDTLPAKVAEISPTADTNSRTFHVKLDLPTNALLRSGQFGYAQVPMRKIPQMMIPGSAVVQRGQLEGVFLTQNNTAVLRLVRTGKRDLGLVQILSGLEDGEAFIVAPPASLRDGDLVEVRHE